MSQNIFITILLNVLTTVYIHLKYILWTDSTFKKVQYLSRYQRNKENKQTDTPKHGQNGLLRLFLISEINIENQF